MQSNRMIFAALIAGAALLAGGALAQPQTTIAIAASTIRSAAAWPTS